MIWKEGPVRRNGGLCGDAGEGGEQEDDQGRPVVTGVSSPTTVGTFEYYAELSTTDDISYGLGTVIMALIETSGLPAAE